MANENETHGGAEGRNEELDQDKTAQFGQSRQPAADPREQQPQAGQQGRESQFGQQSEPGETGSQDGSGSSGFVGSRGEESGDYLQQRQGSDEQDFANQGRGALDESDGGDIEGGGERSANRSSDVEGSSSENR